MVKLCVSVRKRTSDNGIQPPDFVLILSHIDWPMGFHSGSPRPSDSSELIPATLLPEADASNIAGLGLIGRYSEIRK